jgi:hypothetical protein
VRSFQLVLGGKLKARHKREQSVERERSTKGFDEICSWSGKLAELPKKQFAA